MFVWADVSKLPSTGPIVRLTVIWRSAIANLYTEGELGTCVPLDSDRGSVSAGGDDPASGQVYRSKLCSGLQAALGFFPDVIPQLLGQLSQGAG